MVREHGDRPERPADDPDPARSTDRPAARFEREALERGAVEGQLFHRGAVQALAPEEPALASHLVGLVRKELVRPAASLLPGDDAFRFRHLLIRDAAYEALSKATRAELHERFAGWIAERGADLVELDEILGYHLEQAARYRAELGTPSPEVAARAATHLAAAGARALERSDFHAAANLHERATSLLEHDDPCAPGFFRRLPRPSTGPASSPGPSPSWKRRSNWARGWGGAERRACPALLGVRPRPHGPGIALRRPPRARRDHPDPAAG